MRTVVMGSYSNIVNSDDDWLSDARYGNNSPWLSVLLRRNMENVSGMNLCHCGYKTRGVVCNAPVRMATLC